MLLGPATPIGSHQPSAEETATQKFFERIFGVVGPGRYLNIHHIWQPKAGEKPSFPGTAYESFEAAAKAIHKSNWIARAKSQPYEQAFHCISAQAVAVESMSKKGNRYLRAGRAQDKAVGLKTLFADLDVKPKAFPTQADALAAIIALVHAGDIPRPTIAVSSGNGIHMYWTLDRILAPAEWLPLAEGFGRFLTSKGIFQDPIFANSVCLLRPPGAWNLKDPMKPKQVRLIGTPAAFDHNPRLFEKYLPYRNVVPLPLRSTPGAVTSPRPVAAPGSAVQGVIAATAGVAIPVGFQGLVRPAIKPEGELSEGLEDSFRPGNMAVAVKKCPLLRGVQAKHGADDLEPLWRMVLLASSFDPNGRAWAHEMSYGHRGYTQQGTDAKFNTVLDQRARAHGKIGWPTCHAFSLHSNACLTCPFNGKVHSPFNIPDEEEEDSTTRLPPGYSVRQGKIWKDAADKTDDGADIPAVAFEALIRDAYIESSPEGPALNMEIVRPNTAPRRIQLPLGQISQWRERVHMTLGQAGMSLAKAENTLAQEFLVAFIRDLQAAGTSQKQREAFGWVKARGGGTGFAYAGRIFLADGTSENGNSSLPSFEARYMPEGDIGPWRAAAKFITDQGRPELELIVASAFTGPLVRLAGMSGLMANAYSPVSGGGKSGAMAVAQAVWGHPVKAMNRVDDTGLSAANKLGIIRHLPMLWDELQAPKDQKSIEMVTLLFTLAQGGERSRLTSAIEQRNAGSWETFLMCASNFSMVDLMRQHAKNTSAGVNRVFEFYVNPIPASARISVGAATTILSACRENYGHAGVIYANAVVANEETLKNQIQKTVDFFEKATRATAEERFWLYSAAVLLVGAALAKMKGLVDFDLQAMRQFLVDSIYAQRTTKDTSVQDVTSAEYGASIIDRFIQFARKTNTYLETDVFVPSTGFIAVTVKLTNEVASALRSPIVHMAQNPGVVRFRSVDFTKWLQTENIPERNVMDVLKQHGGMVGTRAAWARGTQWSGGQPRQWEINLAGGPNFADAIGNLFNLGVRPPAPTQTVSPMNGATP